jgi:hypothetical protein
MPRAERCLWRGYSNRVHPLTDCGNHVLDLVPRRMGQGDQQAAPVGVLGQAGDAGQQ